MPVFLVSSSGIFHPSVVHILWKDYLWSIWYILKYLYFLILSWKPTLVFWIRDKLLSCIAITGLVLHVLLLLLQDRSNWDKLSYGNTCKGFFHTIEEEVQNYECVTLFELHRTPLFLRQGKKFSFPNGLKFFAK